MDLDMLEQDLNQIEKMKRTHKVLITANERYTDFIAKNAELVDSMEYVEKLKRLFYGRIESVKFDKPEAKKMTPVPYYYFTTTVSAKMTLEEINNLAQFVEGGTRKTKITKLRITTPEGNKGRQTGGQNSDTNSIQEKDIQLVVIISITSYSMELGSVEKLYEMSRSKLEEFVGYDGIVFKDQQDEDKFAQSEQPIGEKVTINLGEGDKTLPEDFKRPNIIVTIHSFFAGGSNFILYANNGENNQFANFKTKKRQSVFINLNDYMYSLQTEGNTDKKIQFSGEAPKRTRFLLVNANFPDIIENSELGADIKIVNNSQYNITVKIDGRKDKIAIFGKGERDKIYLL
jgi:hypothetical protein